jgi:uncharacterized protein YndB with AHSA1/START domain
MTKRTIDHSTFVIERTYPAAPARVFAAWADPASKKKWFCGPDDANPHHELDFRVGGRETSRGGPPGGPVYRYDAVYRDIVPEQRIVSTYEMYMGDARISVSLATVELAPDGAGTRLTYTEHGAFLDGHDSAAQRRRGTEDLLDKLGGVLGASNNR